MRVAYEDVIVAPKGELTQELMACTLEEELANQGTEIIEPRASTETTLQEASDRKVGIEKGESGTKISEAYPNSPRIIEDEGNITITNSLPKSTMLAQTKLKREEPELDTGASIRTCEITNVQLTSDRARILAQIFETTGREQVNRKKLEFAPAWVVEEALKKEYDSNWSDALNPVQEKSVSRQANVITSHMVYQIKKNEDGTHQLKAIIVPRGNRDSEKDSIRKDSSRAQFDVIRIPLSVAAILKFRLAPADVQGAYLQSGPIQREIYVKPPRELKKQRGVIWKLTKLPYGISEAGSQSPKEIEYWMLTSEGGNLERVYGISQIYVLRDQSGKLLVIVAKFTEDILVGGQTNIITNFVNKFKGRFRLGKVIINERFNFNGYEVSQENKGDITLSMEEYKKQLREIPLSYARKRQLNENTTADEITILRGVAGTLLWRGKCVTPPATYASSTLRQSLANLEVSHLVEPNNLVRSIRKLQPLILYKHPTNPKSAMVTTLSDASFNISARTSYGQTGVVAGLRIIQRGKEDIYHLLDWVSNKHKRICHLSYGAEIPACAEGDDRGFYIRTTI